MIKRDIVETVYEYDKEGKLLKKTVTETHEEETNTVTTYPSWTYCNDSLITTTTTNKHNTADSINACTGMMHPN
jgi:hypothetical protein